jgi:5'-nucleotidase
MKKILYIDMDNVLVDFPSGIKQVPQAIQLEYEDHLDEVPNIFSLMQPMQGAVEAFDELAGLYDTYILSTAPWENPSAWSDKLIWVKKYLGKSAYKRLILSHHKNLNDGHYLVDDRTKNGVDKFKGVHIHFGTPEFPNWHAVTKFLKSKVE